MLTAVAIIGAIVLSHRNADSQAATASQAQVQATTTTATAPLGPTAAVAVSGDGSKQTGTAARVVPAIRVVQKRWSAVPTYSSVSEALRDLLPAAEGGDTHAMLAIAQSIGECRLGFTAEKVVKEMKSELVASGQSTEEEVDERVAKLRAYCDRPPAEMLSLYRYWALRAADLGDGEAALYVAFETPYPGDVETMVDRAQQLGGNDPESVKQITDLSLQYARIARDRGEFKGAFILAMPRMDSAKDPGPLVRYEHAWLASRLLEAKGSKPLDRWLKDSGDQLLPIQREEAEDRARALFDRVPEWIDRDVSPTRAAPDAESPTP